MALKFLWSELHMLFSIFNNDYIMRNSHAAGRGDFAFVIEKFYQVKISAVILGEIRADIFYSKTLKISLKN